jgi:hypothetical protein
MLPHHTANMGMTLTRRSIEGRRFRRHREHIQETAD